MSLARNFLSVGGLTLLSRVTGFARDVALGAVLGAGLLADAFYIAFRLPNHFRAIFGEGAFNAAYVPSYARVLETEGAPQARRFSGQIATLLLISQLVLLALAWAFTRQLLDVLAPGFDADPQKMALAITMTRITFPYLLCVTLVTLVSGTLNAHGRFAAAAFAPVMLNVAIVAMMLLAVLFPNAGVAASVGILIAGVAELAIVVYAAWRAGAPAQLDRPTWSADVKQFFKAFGPAVIGSAGVQIALFADTIIGSLLPTGGISSIYYADRLYQLPIGVIGIAAGTVLLPEMSRRFSSGDDKGALSAQSRAMAFTIALSAPFFVAFLFIPELIMRGVFMRGAFDAQAAAASARVLQAYGVGLLAIVLIRAAVASFQARGDTTTPMVIALTAVAFNLGLKLFLYRPLGAPGLALATAVGAWVNFGLLALLASRRGDMRLDALTWKTIVASAFAGLLLALLALFGAGPIEALARAIGGPVAVVSLLMLALTGVIVYGAALFGALMALGVRPGALRPLRRAGAPKPGDAPPDPS